MRKKGWRVPRLAEELGIPESSTYNIFKKPLKYHPRADIVYDIARLFDVSVEYLMTGKEPEIKEETIDSVKRELIEHIKTVDHDTAVEIRAMIKTLQLMTLKKESRRNEPA